MKCAYLQHSHFVPTDIVKVLKHYRPQDNKTRVWTWTQNLFLGGGGRGGVAVDVDIDTDVDLR